MNDKQESHLTTSRSIRLAERNRAHVRLRQVNETPSMRQRAWWNIRTLTLALARLALNQAEPLNFSKYQISTQEARLLQG